MSFHHGAGFRVCGAVVRKFVAPSGKCAFLTLDVNAHPRSKKIEFRAFSDDMIEEIGGLGVGMTVEVTGNVDMEPVKSKDRKEVLVDGRAKWVPVLTVKALKIEGSSRQPAPRAPAEPAPKAAKPAAGWDENDDYPF